MGLGGVQGELGMDWPEQQTWTLDPLRINYHYLRPTPAADGKPREYLGDVNPTRKLTTKNTTETFQLGNLALV